MSTPIGNSGVSAAQFQNSGTPAIGTAEGTIATLLPGQILCLQNLATEVLYVRLGGTASATAFHYVLPACTAAKDGTSPPIFIDNWSGIVSLAKVATASYTSAVLS